jgi:isocitrate dehydrogenase kinase/phosphatase
MRPALVSGYRAAGAMAYWRAVFLQPGLFLVDMEVPSAYVQFLRSMLPSKTKAELYTMLGLQKQGKNTFYRDFMQHLQHSNDQFIIAPGIRGLVMLVFTLPSYPMCSS